MDIIEYIEEFCSSKGYEFRTNYSGRFMYGKTCVGFVCADINSAFEELLWYLVEFKNLTCVLSRLGDVHIDNMALDYIVYFPSLCI